jgi:integrase/recombinase XerD
MSVETRSTRKNVAGMARTGSPRLRQVAIHRPPDLAALAESWLLELRAVNKAANTIRNYDEGVRNFLKWCETTDTTPELTKATVQTFLSDMLDRGLQPTTARSRYSALKRFSAWLASEHETPTDDLLGIQPPKLDVKVVDPLSDAELRDLVKVCRGKDFRSRRDEAIVRIMAETGLRAAELLSLKVADLDLPHGTALVRKGKGAKARIVPFSPQTSAALDRYLRIRRDHKLADTQDVWLGARSNAFNYTGLWRTLAYRAKLAGIDGMHPHRMRHTAATRWLAAGGSEGGLMQVAGWSKREMLDRYVRATASDRAADEARKLNLGDM